MRDREISIHALLTESDAMFASMLEAEMLFQSTLSSRRATVHPVDGIGRGNKFQSTLSSRRATLESKSMVSRLLFQSTLSSRRAT